MKPLIVILIVLVLIGGCTYKLTTKPPCIEYGWTVEYSVPLKQVLPVKKCIKRAG